MDITKPWSKHLLLGGEGIQGRAGGEDLPVAVVVVPVVAIPVAVVIIEKSSAGSDSVIGRGSGGGRWGWV